jgi:Protein of unknown function (DUF4089)
MKRKAAKKVKPAAPKTKSKATARQTHDPIGDMVAANAAALGLKLDPAWESGIKFNLQLILRHAALVDEFPLPDDAEPAPIFHA